MISKEKIHDYTDIYVESYMRALEKVHNPDLAVQAAMGIVTVLRTLEQQQEEVRKQENVMNPLTDSLFTALYRGEAPFFAGMYAKKKSEGEDEDGC